MAYWSIFVVIFFAGFAMTVREGLWSNTVKLLNILISGLAAFAFYPPLAVWLDEQLDGEYTYLLDFVLVWGLFSIAMVICRLTTGMLSRTRMRFKHPIDPVGGPVMGLCASWVLGSFTMATLHMVPMPKDALSGKLVYSRTDDVNTNSSFSSPDLGWLRFVERMSDATSFGAESTDHFSAAGFVAAYMTHREKLEKATAPWLRVKRG